jgi:cytochrome c peroxidase
MGNTLDAVLQFLNADANYSATFTSIYPDGVSINNMAAALAYFQRINFTRFNTPFMRHLNGAGNELGEQALRGWQRFDELGCVHCHNGINLGGNSYQQLGAAIPYYGEERTAAPPDMGVMERSQREQDIHVFKVPGLHHVAATAPWFHDGSVPTLEAAIAEMAEHQLGRQASEQDIQDIASFLRALSGRSMDMGLATSALLGREDKASPDAVMPAVESSASHHQAYLDAIAAIGSAQTRLLTEMRRIHSGAVAHADFLQFQHLELIRHARALQHPPAALDEQTRQQLAARAALLLAAIKQLEWPIADLLRAHAIVHVLESHQHDPEYGSLAGRMGDISARLAQQHEIVRQSMEAIAGSDINVLASALRQLFPRTTSP